MTAALKQIDIHTDGACSGNPGPGGYGVVLAWGSHRKELSGGLAGTTNNRMELLAAIVALEALKEPCRVTLYSDSSYLVNAVEKGWLERWRGAGWRKADRKPVANVDLWRRLHEARAGHRVEFVWVKGHAANVDNNRCDELARAAAARADLLPDRGRETDDDLFDE